MNEQPPEMEEPLQQKAQRLIREHRERRQRAAQRQVELHFEMSLSLNDHAWLRSLRITAEMEPC